MITCKIIRITSNAVIIFNCLPNSYILLKLAIYCGLLGSLFGLVGVSFLELELVSGLFLGLSAAWLPMANNTINYYKFENHLTDSKNMGITVLSLT